MHMEVKYHLNTRITTATTTPITAKLPTETPATNAPETDWSFSETDYYIMYWRVKTQKYIYYSTCVSNLSTLQKEML